LTVTDTRWCKDEMVWTVSRGGCCGWIEALAGLWDRCRDVTMAEALAWAVASGVAVGVARMLAARKAADYWRRSTGSLPPGLEEVG
jgi:Protein of unknown function (DUF4235)